MPSKPKHPKLRITEKDFLLANRRAARVEDNDMTKKNSESLQNSRKGVYLPLQNSRKRV